VTSELHSGRVGFRQIVQHFNPAWFAAVMGTAVIPLAIGFLEWPIIRPAVVFFTVVAAVLFLALLAPWTLRFVLYPQAVRKDMNHPVACSFFPTMPISLVILSLVLLRYPDLFFRADVSVHLAFWLWILGTIGIYGMGFPILLSIFRNQGIELQHANFGWYIPPVSKLIIPVAGFDLARALPQYLELTFGLSIISLGVGFFLFLFVGAAVYHRYVYHELPMSRLAATFFIGMAPTAILAVILFKMWHLFEGGDVLGIDAHVFIPAAKLGILMNWGFSVWWFVMALIVVAYYLRRIELPYALSWWAFTFPSGALGVATGVAWKASGFDFIHTLYVGFVLFLIMVWLLVLAQTVRGVISGRIFAPAH
jgi:C4-dicarboxylate transporter/malic acid transport protein